MSMRREVGSSHVFTVTITTRALQYNLFIQNVDSQELIDQQMLASGNMRPYKEIYRDVVAASRAIPEILAVTHVNAHWVPVKTGYGTLVEVTIVVKPTMTVREAHEVSKMARKRIERIEHVACADIHLELSGIDDTNGC